MGPGFEVAKRFRLERQLGAGGMGTVWAATHLVTHKAVALKFLHKKNDDAEARRRILREARAACAVQHPNVVAVHDVVEDDDGTPILVMDLLRGESLADRLARERTLAPAEAIGIIQPVLSALVAAHGVGIVHRDLKPDNVFLVAGSAEEDAAGSPAPRVRILDFGVAKLSGKDAATKESHRLTETGAMIGTPHYMAPEQAFGESGIDARADLWAVGAVLYECLAGVPPTEGQNLGQILKVLASDRIRPLALRAPAVPAALADVVDRLLAIDRDARPASATAVLELLAAIEPDALVAPAVTPVEPKRRSRRWLVGMAAAIVAASAVVAVVQLRPPAAHASAAVVDPAVAAPRGSSAGAPGAAAPPVAAAASTGAPLLDTPPAAIAAAEVSPAAITQGPAPAVKKTRGAPSAKGSRAAAPAGRPDATPSSGGPLIAEPTF
ncbi:MAG TPA: serine/threonine-protein kinase [Gaiellaceae bacterium]|nr:serine/threonine-protein kinase [Gaiellaceae bacterium]